MRRGDRVLSVRARGRVDVRIIVSIAAAIVSIAAASTACVLPTAAWAAPADGMRADPRPPAVPGRPDLPSGRPGVDLSPSALPPVPDPILGAEPRAAAPVARDLRTGHPRAGANKPARSDDTDDDDLPARPGTFTPAPTKMPSPLHKQRVIAPHTASPDIEMDLSKRSSVGVFGEVGRINREDIRTSTVKEGRDLGAGVTWQYKFDSR